MLEQKTRLESRAPVQKFKPLFFFLVFSRFWLVLFFAFAVMSALYMFADLVADILRELRFAQLDDHKNHTPTTVTGWVTWSKVSYNLKKTWVEMTGGAAEMFDDFDVDKHKPIATTLAKIGWSMFVCITIALYEANLTANLVNARGTNNLIGSLQECALDPRPCTLCIHGTQVNNVDELFQEMIIERGPLNQGTLNEARKRTHAVAADSAYLAEVIGRYSRNSTQSREVPSIETTWKFMNVAAPESTTGCSESDDGVVAYDNAVKDAKIACALVGGTDSTTTEGRGCATEIYNGCIRPSETVTCNAYIYDTANAGLYLNDKVRCNHIFQGQCSHSPQPLPELLPPLLLLLVSSLPLLLPLFG